MSKGDTHFDFVTEFQGEDYPDDGPKNGQMVRLVGHITKYQPAVMYLRNDRIPPTFIL